MEALKERDQRMSDNPVPEPDNAVVEAPVKDEEPNKAIAAAVAFIIAIVQRYLDSGELDWSEEGILGLIGVAGTLAVYYVSNWVKRNRQLREEARARTLGGLWS